MSELTCEEAEMLISASLDGELSPEQQASLDRHLAACPRCRHTLEDATSLGGLVRTSLRTPDETLTSNVRAAVRADARQRRQSRLVRRASAAAAALLVAAGLTIAGRSVMQQNFLNAASNAREPAAEAPDPHPIEKRTADIAAEDDFDSNDENVELMTTPVPGEAKHVLSGTGSPENTAATTAASDTSPTAVTPTSVSLSWDTFFGILLAAAGAVCLALLI